MKRLIYFAGTLGMMWAAPAFSDNESSASSAPTDSARDQVRHALADHASLPPDTASGPKENKDRKDKRDSGSHNKNVDAAKNSAAHADVSNHADKASQHAMHMAHDRAMAHAASDANASHVDAANRAAMHWANGSRDQATSESHDAAGQMRTRIEHGDTRGMDRHGEGSGEGSGGYGERSGGGEGGGWSAPGSSGPTSGPTSTQTGISGLSTTRTGR